MVQRNVVLLSLLFGLVSLFSVSHCQILGCQFEPQVQFFHVVDTSADMSEFIGGSTFEDFTLFEQWANNVFTQNVTSGIGTFAERSQNCYTTEQELGSNGVSDNFLQLANDLVSPSAFKRDVYDGIIGAANELVKSPHSGQNIIIVYTKELPQINQNDINMQYDDIDCNSHELPSTDSLSLYFNRPETEHIRIVFVVPSRHISGYKELFSWLGDRLSVVALSARSYEFFVSLYYAMDEIYCHAPPPGLNAVSPDVCAQETVLQLLHLQDFSWSYTNDLSDLIGKMPDLLQGLKDRFHERQVALGTLVGYCYREDSVFSTDANLFINALSNVTIQSGRDWLQSHYGAIADGIKSLTLGWNDYATTADNRPVLRVVIVATDAGFHRENRDAGFHRENRDAGFHRENRDAGFHRENRDAGFHRENRDAGFHRENRESISSSDGMQQNEPEMNGCESEDYPSDEEIKILLEEYNVYPIFLVTSDIVEYYAKNVLNKISTKGFVIALNGDMDTTIQNIMSATEAFCADSLY